MEYVQNGILFFRCLAKWPSKTLRTEPPKTSYTTNPHERSANNGQGSCLPSARRATTERLPSEIARWLFGRRSVVESSAGSFHGSFLDHIHIDRQASFLVLAHSLVANNLRPLLSVHDTIAYIRLSLLVALSVLFIAIYTCTFFGAS